MQQYRHPAATGQTRSASPSAGLSANPRTTSAGPACHEPGLVKVEEISAAPDQPDDDLTTRQRRNRPMLIVHCGQGKGKSTAAFGLALRGWNQGWSIGVFQFVKSAKWRVGEQDAFDALNRVHLETGQGGPVEWHKMGSGWSWARKQSSAVDQAEQARAGWDEVVRRLQEQTHQLYILDEFTYVMKWGWISVSEVLGTLASRPGSQHVVITGRNPAPELCAAADLVTEMTKIKHPFDNGQRGQRGIEW